MKTLNPRWTGAASSPARSLARTVPAPADALAASQATIALLQAHSLTSVVHAEVERLILAGELAPGAKLTEALLAERLVREGHDTTASEAYHRLNLGFHETLVDFVGNRKLSAIYRRLVKELTLLRRANLADGRRIPVSAQEHRAILKAIVAGDAEGAARALRAHVLQSKERTLRNAAAAATAPDELAPRKARNA